MNRQFSWKDAPDLMDRLGRVQNTECFENQDIMTFAGFVNSRDELEKHVKACEARAARSEVV